NTTPLEIYALYSLLFYICTRTDFLKAAGNEKFLNFGSNIGALLMFMYLGQINYAYGFIIGIAQIAGGIIGSKFAIKKVSGYVRALFI
ncbi:TSUP family transporter, partial [Bacillus cereus]|uniref:TSUP family transporter n=1 Tax=Bacillus cereus TaxID=1396 RepID=UPI0018F344FF